MSYLANEKASGTIGFIWVFVSELLANGNGEGNTGFIRVWEGELPR